MSPARKRAAKAQQGGGEFVVLLLRGINVGRAKRIPMAELRELLTELGYEDPRTLLQSGNVVLRTADAPDDVARTVEREIERRFGFDVDVVARSGAELAAVVAANPLGDVVTDGSKGFVVFLAKKPAKAALAAAAEEQAESERLEVVGRELYTWCPDGVRDSRLMAALSRSGAAGGVATARNWNTVAKLAAMVDPQD
jgi:uncharacterized protein (DUF1697 family)